MSHHHHHRQTLTNSTDQSQSSQSSTTPTDSTSTSPSSSSSLLSPSFDSNMNSAPPSDADSAAATNSVPDPASTASTPSPPNTPATNNPSSADLIPPSTNNNNNHDSFPPNNINSNASNNPSPSPDQQASSTPPTPTNNNKQPSSSSSPNPLTAPASTSSVPSPSNPADKTNPVASTPSNALNTNAPNPTQLPSKSTNLPNPASSNQPNLALSPNSDTTSTSTSPRSTEAPHQNHQSSPNGSVSGANIGMIVGILVAAIVGSLVIVALIAVMKRRRRARKNVDLPHDFFDEKPVYNVAEHKQSSSSDSFRMPKSSHPAQTLGVRGDIRHGPRPPSIIERHQASPAALPGLAPSYQPAQTTAFKAQPSFNLRRPKPPVYHDYPTESDLAYANSPIAVDHVTPSGSGKQDRNPVVLHGWPSQKDSAVTHHLPMHNMPLYSSPATLPSSTDYGPYTSTNSTPPSTGSGHQNLAQSYQRQVDQLDFIGQSSPLPTVVRPYVPEWPKSPQPLSSDASVAVATGVAVSDNRSGTLMESNPQQNQVGASYRLSESTTLNNSRVEDSNGIVKLEVEHGQLGSDWKLASPQLSSPIGEIFNHPSYGDLVEGTSSGQNSHEEFTPVLKVTNE